MFKNLFLEIHSWSAKLSQDDNTITLTEIEKAECFRMRGNIQNFIGFIEKRDPQHIVKRVSINFEKRIVNVTYNIRGHDITT